MDGNPRHSIVSDGLQVLRNLQHRGAVGGDQKTGDGAGIMTQIPHDFFKKTVSGMSLPEKGSYAVGMAFFPHACDTDAYKKSIELSVESRGFALLGWREVPVDSEGLGELALTTEPGIHQFFITHESLRGDALQRQLYVLRRLIEKNVEEVLGGKEQFYICSLSSSVIVYKGMLTGDQVEPYYPDLRSKEYVSAFAIIHSRFSTNTLPQVASGSAVPLPRAQR